MNPEQCQSFVNEVWNDSIVPELIEYIKIPNKSPLFDSDWAAHGYMEDAVSMMTRWAGEQAINGMEMEVVRLPGRTPLIFIDLPGEVDDTILLYGHLDKQPEMVGWRDDLGPWKPIIEDGKLYGRGGADDGYALYASLTAIKALSEQDIPRARCVVIIEACEESGSYDLPYYIDALNDRIGSPSLVVCLDSGCGNYDQLWCTTSLRGMVAGDLSVQVLDEGVHSGDASGIVPSSFRILRDILSRVEDVKTGAVTVNSCHVDIPEQRMRQAQLAGQVLGDTVYTKFPFAEKTRPTGTDLTELVLNRTWRPALAVTGSDGIPPVRFSGQRLTSEYVSQIVVQTTANLRPRRGAGCAH